MPVTFEGQSMNKLQTFFRRDDVRKRWIPIGAAVLVLAIAAAVLLRILLPRRITVAVDPTWPPFESKDNATQELVGFDIDLMNAIAGKANLDVEYVSMGFDRIMKDLAECKIDAAISLISVTEKRMETMAFSDSYFQLGQQLVVRAGNDEILGVGYLEGRKVGAQIGTAGAGETAKFAGVQVIAYNSVPKALAALGRGELDAVALDNTLAYSVVADSGGELKTAGAVFAAREVAIAVCQKDTSLLNRINKGLDAVEEDGLLDGLMTKWLTGEG
jgi:polar amino acid transport system substrate-binding protein